MTVDKKHNKYVRRWKGLTFDYNTIVAQENLPTTVHCLSATTRMLLASILPLLSWVTRYDGENMDTDKIATWAAKAAYELGGNMIRQNPANPCQLQMSCDGGNAWTTVFDYSTCVPDAQPDSAVEFNNEIETNSTTYAGDISNLTDAWDYDGTYPEADTNAALCWAIQQYVAMVCDAQISKINKKNEEPNYLQDLAVFSGFGAAVAGVLAAAGLFVATAVTGGAALALLAVVLAMSGEWDDEDPSAFADEETREEIKCAIYESIAGTKPTFTSWSAALTATADPVNNYVRATMQSEDLFMQFLFLTGGMVGAAGSMTNECENCIGLNRLSGDGRDEMWSYEVGNCPAAIYDAFNDWWLARNIPLPDRAKIIGVGWNLEVPVAMDYIKATLTVHRTTDSGPTNIINLLVDDVEVGNVEIPSTDLTEHEVIIETSAPVTGQVIKVEGGVFTGGTSDGLVNLTKVHVRETP